MTSRLAVAQFLETRSQQSVVHEYRNDIHSHFLHLDFKYKQNPVPPPVQPQLAQNRFALLNSIFDVTEKLSWSYATFSLAVYLLDRYISKVLVHEKNFKLVGYCCLWIASKYNENKPKGKLINALIKRAGYELDRKPDFLRLELDIMSVLKWDVSLPTADYFVQFYTNSSQPNLKERHEGAMFLCELAHFDRSLLYSYTPSCIAVAAIVLTNMAAAGTTEKLDELQTGLLRHCLAVPSSIRAKYFNSGNRIFTHLTNMATSVHHKARGLELPYVSYAPHQSSPIQELVLYPNLPISPIASPIHHQRHSHTRTQSISSLRSRQFDSMGLPSPGTTPVSSAVGSQTITPIQMPLDLDERSVKRRRYV
ncbi:hypothetical protein OGAPHI_007322 [Ogataea philodendri]|uniref:Cyclin-like domain-containing protein n=1 Tax=Ogataea philodendri TaxID=1378263 RepID=A0A9P8NVQ3_9ASCO|nr:uncharacterized protein OGAPHI_007322 [Ogataea philodendri]KAH3660117.1 hypothetical protein OGAPHI_007322 [Ogataea philodendri]